MFSVLSRRTLALAAASLALVGVTSACGFVETAATCGEAKQLFTDYTSRVTSASGDLNALNTANKDLADKLKDLAAKSDGELATALNEMANTWAGFTIDPANPAEAMSKVTEFSKSAQESATKLGNICG